MDLTTEALAVARKLVVADATQVRPGRNRWRLGLNPGACKGVRSVDTSGILCEGRLVLPARRRGTPHAQACHPSERAQFEPLKFLSMAGALMSEVSLAVLASLIVLVAKLVSVLWPTQFPRP